MDNRGGFEEQKWAEWPNDEKVSGNEKKMKAKTARRR
jgi:hypothetical protein